MDGGPYVDRSQLMCRGCGGVGGGGGGGAGCAIAIVVVVLVLLLKGCWNKTRKQRIPTGGSFFRYWTPQPKWHDGKTPFDRAVFCLGDAIQQEKPQVNRLGIQVKTQQIWWIWKRARSIKKRNKEWSSRRSPQSRCVSSNGFLAVGEFENR